MIQKFTNAETIFRVEGSLGKKLGVSHGCEYIFLTIQPGKIIPSHSLDIPVTFYVVRGLGELVLDEEKYLVEKGDLIEIKPQVKREWKSNAEENLELLVVKHI